MKNGTSLAGEKRQITRHLPPGGYSCTSFTIRELDGHDDIEIAVLTEAAMAANPALRNSAKARAGIEEKEGWRRSIVAVDGASITPGVPYLGFDKWNKRTLVVLIDAFNELNAVETAELEKIRAGEFSPTTPAKKEKIEGREVRTDAPSAA